MKVRFTLNIGYVGAEHEEIVDYEDTLEGLSDEEVEKEIYKDWERWIWEHIDGSAKVISDDEEDY